MGEIPFEPPIPEPPIGQPLRPTFEPPVIPKPVPIPEPAPAPVPPLVLPPEPGIPEALPELGIIAMLIVVLGLIALATLFVDLFKWLMKLVLGPLYSRSRASSLTGETLQRQIATFLYPAYQGVDNHLGLSFTKLGAMTGRTGGAILATERRLYTAITHLARLERGQAALKGENATTNARVQAVQHTAIHAETRAATEATRAQAHEGSLQAQLDGLTHHVTHVLEPELDALRHKIPQLEKGATTAWDEIKKHEEALGIGALTAATAVALGRLGADWTTCESPQQLGQSLCGAGGNFMRRLLRALNPFKGLLEALLAGAVEALILSDICELAGLLSDETAAIVPVLMTFVDVEDALIGCHGASKPPRLNVPRLSLPPVTGYVTA